MGSRPIQSQPAGLLGFLQLKNMGKNPAELPDTLQTVLEMRDWYWQTNTENIVGVDAAIAAAGLVNKLTVPDGEWWAVHEVQITATLAAASTVIVAPYYRQSVAGSLSFPFQLRDPFTWVEATLGASLNVQVDPSPLLIPPGAILGIRAYAVSAATTAGNLVARITRLRN